MSRHRPALRWAAAVAASALLAGSSPAFPDVLPFRGRLDRVNRELAGRVLDFTNHHGADRRVYSPALDARHDLYVYLPPGYDGVTRFPGVLWLHGLGHDERIFLDVVPIFDAAIRAGTLPPCVIACPNGSIKDRPINTGSFYLNGVAGRYADWVACDAWGFVRANFAVRPEREAHAITGVSMGGFGAYYLGLTHRSEFGVLAGLMPPLNLRYGDCHGRYMTDYDPACFGLRETDRRREVIGRFYGVLLIRARRLLDPVAGRRPADPTGFVASINPAELLTTLGVRPGEFEMFVGYGTKDEFNLDAQCASFVAMAAARGIRPDVLVVPDGRHNSATALAMFPPLSKWLTEKLGPFAPPGYSAAGCGVGGRAAPLGAVPRVPFGPRGPVHRPDPFPPFVGPVPLFPIPEHVPGR